MTNAKDTAPTKRRFNAELIVDNMIGISCFAFFAVAVLYNQTRALPDLPEPRLVHDMGTRDPGDLGYYLRNQQASAQLIRSYKVVYN